jgi:hypothetical protein
MAMQRRITDQFELVADDGTTLTAVEITEFRDVTSNSSSFGRHEYLPGLKKFETADVFRRKDQG